MGSCLGGPALWRARAHSPVGRADTEGHQRLQIGGITQPKAKFNRLKKYVRASSSNTILYYDGCLLDTYDACGNVVDKCIISNTNT